MTPNRVNRAHWPTKEKKQMLCIFFCFFRSMEKMAWDGRKWAPRGIFPANPDLADILGRTDLNFENFHVLICWIPNLWISRSPDFQIPRPRPGPTVMAAFHVRLRKDIRAQCKTSTVKNQLAAASAPKKTRESKLSKVTGTYFLCTSF